MSNLPACQPDHEPPSAEGIMKCLRMLADEASSLELAATVDALRTAIAICAAESDPVTAGTTGAPDGVVLH